MKTSQRVRNISRVVNYPSPDQKIRRHAGERVAEFSDSLFADFINSLEQKDFIEYPDLSELKKALADKHKVSIDNIFLAAGSDEVISKIFSCFVDFGEVVLMPQARFPMYDVYAQQCGALIANIDYVLDNGKLCLDLDAALPKCADVSLAIIANPNSPVGDVLSLDDILKLKVLGCPIVVDQAYLDFGGIELPLNLIDDNFIFVNSFSKSYGAAGIRVGYAVASKEIIEILGRLRSMFEVTKVSEKFALHLLNSSEVSDYTSKINEEREKLKDFGIEVNAGNWVHLNEEYADVLSAYSFKQNVSLPLYSEKLIRISIFPGLSDILSQVVATNS